MNSRWANIELEKFAFSASRGNAKYSLPKIIHDSIECIDEHFSEVTSNKICLVFPAKENIAQLLGLIFALRSIKSDFEHHADDIYNAHRKYNPGDKLILNDDAIVEWVGADEKGIKFRTKKERRASGATIKVKFQHIVKLKPAPGNRKALSTFKRVKEAFDNESKSSIDQLLKINAQGNDMFMKGSISLISAIKKYREFEEKYYLNSTKPSEYLRPEIIDIEGNVESHVFPLLLSNSLGNLSIYANDFDNVNGLIIDGIAPIQERLSDFRDIDDNALPIILISDLSETDDFEFIDGLGFDNLFIESPGNEQVEIDRANPFRKVVLKSRNFRKSEIVTEIIESSRMDELASVLHSIKLTPDTSKEISYLYWSLIKSFNSISRWVRPPSNEEKERIKNELFTIEQTYDSNKTWLGENLEAIGQAISSLKVFTKNPDSREISKTSKFIKLLNSKKFDYVLTPLESEAKELLSFIRESAYIIPDNKPKVICAIDLNDLLLQNELNSLLVVGWLKTSILKKLIGNFYFTHITYLFYPFELKYFNSFNRNGLRAIATLSHSKTDQGEGLGSSRLFRFFGGNDKPIEDEDFDISSHELKIDQAIYSRYHAEKGNVEALKAKRIEFQNDCFMYSAESHRLLVINDLIDGISEEIKLTKVENIVLGDVIVFLATSRDILVETVEKLVSKDDLKLVNPWISLWKSVLREQFKLSDNNISLLNKRLRQHGCEKHEVTIRNWILDETRIGPSENQDLIAIAKIGKNEELLNNIDTVRKAITQMKRWRKKASEIILSKIKSELNILIRQEDLNASRQIEGFGKITVLKVRSVEDQWESIELRYINKILEK